MKELWAAPGLAALDQLNGQPPTLAFIVPMTQKPYTFVVGTVIK